MTMRFSKSSRSVRRVSLAEPERTTRRSAFPRAWVGRIRWWAARSRRVKHPRVPGPQRFARNDLAVKAWLSRSGRGTFEID
ncbi:hypothetical protein Rcae01_04226 [Novipirellula caenicola]|uniref:Uncharacterized protein n=1 Tax=Novipirellula caenicola TaxID=1536901 RepID=A0ABP9VUC6_9BACT